MDTKVKSLCGTKVALETHGTVGVNFCALLTGALEVRFTPYPTSPAAKALCTD